MQFITEYVSVHVWVWVAGSSYEQGQRVALIKGSGGMCASLSIVVLRLHRLWRSRLWNIHICWNCGLKESLKDYYWVGSEIMYV